MRVLFVSDTYYPHLNGVYYFVRRLAVLLQEKGHQVMVLVPSENIRFSVKKIDGIDVYRIPSFPLLIYPRIRIPIPLFLQAKIKELLVTLKPDVIHLQDHFSLAEAVVNANKSYNIPIIGTNHFMPENITALLPISYWNKPLENWMWTGFSKVFNNLALVTTPTEMGVELIRNKLDVKVVAISNGIDLDHFSQVGYTGQIRNKYSLPNKPTLLYVGRLDPEKHLEEVIYAVARALQKIDFCFVVVGKGVDKKSLQNLTHELGIQKHVIFTGFVSDEDLPCFYRLSNCFIIASIAELQSISTMQAMASGLPVIAAKAGALTELVNDGVNGFLFNPGDIDTIARKIITIVGIDDRCWEMGNESVKHIRKHNIHNTLQLFEEVYGKIMINAI